MKFVMLLKEHENGVGDERVDQLIKEVRNDTMEVPASK